MSSGTVLEPILFPDGQCRMILIGKTGNGKSSTGNSILGRKAFRAQVGINSGTKEGDLQSTMRGEIQIQVMDTPGLHDTSVKDDVIAQRITQSLLAIHPGPHAIILCLSCDQRFTQDEVRVFEALKDIFGENMTSYLIVVLNRRDVLEAKGQCFENQLAHCTELKKVLQEADNRYVLFDNTDNLSPERKKEQVDQLLAKVQKVLVQNGGNHFRHKLTAVLNDSMIKMREAETESETAEENVYNRLGHYDIPPSKPVPKARGVAAKEEPREKKAWPEGEGSTASRTSTLPQSIMVLKDKKQVTERRAQFESAAQRQQQPELSREEISAKFQKKPREDATGYRRPPLGATQRQGPSSHPQNKEIPARGAPGAGERRGWAGQSRDSPSGGQEPEQTIPQGRPQRKPLGTPGVHAATPGISEDYRTPPEKPPRPGLQRKNDLEDAFQRFGFSGTSPKEEDSEYARMVDSFVYEVADRPGMTLSQKQRMVEEKLKRRLAQGGAGLNEEQQRVLEKTSKTLGQKIREAMNRFKVEKLDKCTLM